MIFMEMMILLVFTDYLCYRSWKALLVLFPGGILYIKWRIREKRYKRRRILQYQFKEVLTGLKTAIGAGYSMEQSVRECRKEVEHIFGHDADMVKELKYMEYQIKVGVPVEKLFMDLGKRSGVEDIRNFGEIFWISRRSGGNLGEIMEKMTRVLSEKLQTDKEIQTCMSGKKLEQTVMSFVPAGMLLYVQATSGDFLSVLYHNFLGQGIMTVCLAVYILSVVLGRKIVGITI